MGKAPLSVVQDKIYNILVEFDRVCRKHNIKYTLEGGSLLGAVKYQNYVPWDDDIDVVMIRSEYEKFLSIAPKELNENFFLQSYNNVKQFPLNYAKLCYVKSKIHDYDYSHLDMCHGIFMDIFPIDNVNPKKLKRHTKLVGVLTSTRRLKLKMNLGKVSKRKLFVYKILSLLSLKTLTKLVDKACKKDNKKSTGYRYEICNSNKKFRPLRAEIYEDLIELPFRDRSFYVVKDYDGFLASRFGENYMNELPPEEKRKPSHCANITINE